MRKFLYSMFAGAALFCLTAPSVAKAENAVIAEGSKVKLHYKLTVENQIVDNSYDGQPIEFTVGSKQVLPGIETKIQGMGAGEKTSFALPATEGFGSRNEEAVTEIPKTSFGETTDLKPGAVFSGQAPDGSLVRGSVVEVKDETVVVDFNHPLAGKEVTVEVEILEVS